MRKSRQEFVTPYIFILFLFFLPGYEFAHACVQPPSNIVAWWPFDEDVGTTALDIVGSNDGSYVGNPVQSPGMIGNSLLFDGIDDYVAAPDSDLWAFGTDEFTIEFWANFDIPAHGTGGHPGDVFISHDEGPFNVPKWFFSLNSSTLDFLTCCGPGWAFSPNAPFSPTTGQWYHLAVTRSETDYRLFVDGQLRAAGSNSSTIPNIDSILTIGRALEPFGGFMNGRLDEMTIYHRALAESELRAIAAAGAEGKCKDLTITTQDIGVLQLSTESSQQLEAVSGTTPFTWSILSGALPSGMSLSTDGVFSGTPTELGDSMFAVLVTDSNGEVADMTFTVEVVLVLPPPSIRVTRSNTTPVPGRIIDNFILLENTGDVAVVNLPVVEWLNPLEHMVISSTPAMDIDLVTANTLGNLVWSIPRLQPGQNVILQYQSQLSSSIPLGELVGGYLCVGRVALGVMATCWRDIIGAVRSCGSCRLLCLPNTVSPIELCLTCLARCGINSANYLVCLEQGAEETLEEAEACFEPEITTTGPEDPNEKLIIGNSMKLEDGTILSYIQPDQLLTYPIHFENIGEVEALDVFVTDVLDLNLDDSTLKLLTPNGASYDSATRTVHWELLDRNLQPGETGNVLLSIRPVPDLPTGAVIRNSAEIKFEIFESLITPEVINIIDTTKPNCTVDALPQITTTEEMMVGWTGEDKIGEIDTYTVFVSENGGIFKPLISETSSTSISYTGVSDNTYGFLCVAKDTAGNIELQELVAETSTKVTIAASGGGSLSPLFLLLLLLGMWALRSRYISRSQ